MLSTLRMLPIGRRALWFVVAAASVFVASPLAAQPPSFSDASLTGGFGCNGTWRGPSGDITELMQLNFDSIGGVAGSVHFLFSGEDCLASIDDGSGYSVDADGLGTLTLNILFSGRDTDKDFNCATLNFSSFTLQKVDFVLERQADVFDMAAQDDFFSARSDRGDTPYSFTGACTAQISF
jgi:hypothetical protein